MYPNGFVNHVSKGKAPEHSKGLAKYLAKYVASPPISLKRLLNYDGDDVTYFSYYRTGNVLCDGDACVISGSKDLMHSYRIRMTLSETERPIVKKRNLVKLLKGLSMAQRTHGIEKLALDFFL